MGRGKEKERERKKKKKGENNQKRRGLLPQSGKNKWMLCINIHCKGNKILAKSQEHAGKTEDGEKLSY